MTEFQANFNIEPRQSASLNATLNQHQNIEADFILYAQTIAIAWGNITGLLENQLDLQNALNLKANKNITINGYSLANNVILKTSDLTNDSGYITISPVTTAIETHNTSNVAHSDIRTALGAEVTNRTNADTALQTQVTRNTTKFNDYRTALSQDNIDTALSNRITANTNNFSNYRTSSSQDTIDTSLSNRITANTGAITLINTTISTFGNIVTHNVDEFATATQGAKADTALQSGANITELTNNANYIKLTSLSAISPIKYTNSTGVISVASGYQIPTTTQIGLINSALQVNDILNITNSTATNKALSANMGKELQDQINNLKQRGRYLSTWNCTTGLAGTTPTFLPYTYKTGDYFIISTIDIGTNYKPSGSQYTGVASTAVETSEVAINDTYYYDGTTWSLLHGSAVVVTFGNIGGQPTDNTNLAAALNAKQNSIDNSNKLLSDLVNDDNQTNKFVTTSDIRNWNNKIDANVAIQGATHTKITYDNKGLITGGADLQASDIPNLTLTKITDVTVSATELNYCNGVTSNIQTQLNSKLTANSTITGATKCKITYDSKGLVTAGADLSASDIPNLTLSKITDITATAGELNYISGVTSNIQTQLNTKQDNLPTQTGQSGKFLTTNGTILSWANVDVFPSQTGQSGKYLTTDGSSTSWATIQQAPSTDNETISLNTDNELQAIAVKDNNSNAIKTWTGTKAQYDAITTKDTNTFYNITDDTDITLSLLETIYPVGSIYITTNTTCPLSALFGTWELVAGDRVLQGAGNRGTVGTTVNESLPNIRGSFSLTRQNNANTLVYGTGAFYDNGYSSGTQDCFWSTDTTSNYEIAGFNASRSSSTYQDNAPVQQDAYLVNIFRRTA